MQIIPRRGRAGTRDALMAAGLRLFSEAGTDSVGIDEIAQAASVSKQTFYNHFADKPDLLGAIHASVRSGIKQFIDRVNEAETDPARRMARGLCAYAVLALGDRLRGRFVARTLLHDLGTDSALNRGVVDDIAMGLAQGRLSALVLETGVAFTLGTTQALAARILGCADLPSAVAVSQHFAVLLLRAFGLPHAEAEMIASQAADQVVRLGARAGVAELPTSQARSVAYKAARAALPGAGSDRLGTPPRATSA